MGEHFCYLHSVGRDMFQNLGDEVFRRGRREIGREVEVHVLDVLASLVFDVLLAVDVDGGREGGEATEQFVGEDSDGPDVDVVVRLDILLKQLRGHVIYCAAEGLPEFVWLQVGAPAEVT